MIQIQGAGSQLGYDNSSPSGRSQSLNMGRVHVHEKLEAYERVIGKEKQLVGMKIYLVWTMRRWFKDDIKILRVVILEKGITQEHILERIG